MEVRELRIGNWIKKEFWYKKAIEYYQIKPSHFANNKIILFEPIPITEEWLLKFGFRESETDLRKGNIIVRFGEDRLIVTIIDELVLPKIQYIHQLQNLYFAHHNQEFEYVG